MDTKGKVFKTLAGAAAAIAIFGLSGCLSTPDRSAGRVLDDKMITSKVKGVLDDSPVYKFNDVKVATYKGVVQLSGFVDTEDQRRKAGEVTKRVEWVREVVNNITVKPQGDMLMPTGRSTTGERGTTEEVIVTTQPGTTTITTTNIPPRSTDRSTNPSSNPNTNPNQNPSTNP